MRFVSIERNLCRTLTALLLFATVLPVAVRAATGAVSDAQATITLTEYRTRLAGLDQIVQACQQQVGAAHCGGASVGPDIKVALSTGTRLIRFDWLRELLDQAADPEAFRKAFSASIPANDADDSAPEKSADSSSDKADPKAVTKADPTKSTAAKPAQDKATPGKVGASKDTPANSTPVGDQRLPIILPGPARRYPSLSLDQRLANAHARLQQDMADAGRLLGEGHSAGPASAGQASTVQTDPEQLSPEPNAETPAHRQALDRILSAKEYKPAIHRETILDRIRERFARWLNRTFNKLFGIGSRTRWIGRSFEIVVVVVLCIALVWFLIRIERRGRLGSGLYSLEPGAGAVSARDWQLWLQDARQAAAKGEWRDAIHLVYWASISRLESNGQWPADRARTPREYLALLSPESQQRPILADLTHSFERTWYAGRRADEASFLQAEQLAGRLGAR